MEVAQKSGINTVQMFSPPKLSVLLFLQSTAVQKCNHGWKYKWCAVSKTRGVSHLGTTHWCDKYFAIMHYLWWQCCLHNWMHSWISHPCGLPAPAHRQTDRPQLSGWHTAWLHLVRHSSCMTKLSFAWIIVAESLLNIARARILRWRDLEVTELVWKPSWLKSIEGIWFGLWGCAVSCVLHECRGRGGIGANLYAFPGERLPQPGCLVAAGRQTARALGVERNLGKWAGKRRWMREQ